MRIAAIITIILIFLSGCVKKQKETLQKTESQYTVTDKEEKKVVLTSQLAGTWYTKNKDQLKDELLQYLDEADIGSYSDINALILPHAGYKYSGRVAASGVKQITGKHYNRVVILGPTHRYNMENSINVPPETPLENIVAEFDAVKEFGKYPVTELESPGYVEYIRSLDLGQE